MVRIDNARSPLRLHIRLKREGLLGILCLQLKGKVAITIVTSNMGPLYMLWNALVSRRHESFAALSYVNIDYGGSHA